MATVTAPMDRYQRVNKPRDEAPINQNEVRITAQGLMRNYISYALTLLQDKRVTEIVLKAMGRAINKTVLLAEILKKRIDGLHQNISISSIDITDLWEPLEEGLVSIETTRHVSMISITLSKKELDVSSSGYQAPSTVEKKTQPRADQHTNGNNELVQSAGGMFRGRGRGAGRGPGRGRGGGGGYYNNYGGDFYNGGMGRGRGRGRGYRGGGRGYNNYGYNDGGYGGNDMMSWGRGYGRGRGRGFGPRGRGRGRGRGR